MAVRRIIVKHIKKAPNCNPDLLFLAITYVFEINKQLDELERKKELEEADKIKQETLKNFLAILSEEEIGNDKLLEFIVKWEASKKKKDSKTEYKDAIQTALKTRSLADEVATNLRRILDIFTMEGATEEQLHNACIEWEQLWRPAVERSPFLTTNPGRGPRH